jgi:hypothetical protein
MITLVQITAAMLLSEIMFAPAPLSILPRNEIERLVLAQPESASRELEDRLAGLQDREDRDQAMSDAGFKRVRPADACAQYVYSRKLTATLVRGASVILCDGRRPFVLRTDETPGPWFAPSPGEPSASTPSAPKIR